MKNLFIFLFFAVISTLSTFSQEFDKYFINKTLRLDYAFSGTNISSDIALDEVSQLPVWAGRRGHLSELAFDGNGQVSVYDSKTKHLIYKDSFSSLFQEWQTIPEAQKVKRSYEHVLLVPYPQNSIIVEVSFRNRKGEYETKISHEVDPNDILIKQKGIYGTTPYTVIHKGTNIEKGINVGIVAEGYTLAEVGKFLEHAKAACEEIFKYKAFSKFKNKFNFYAIESQSLDSGVSVPHQKEWKETTLSSHFDTFYSDRYLTTSRVKDLHNVLAGIPYSHIIILANTDVYGGGGIFNSYTLTTTGHAEFNPVVVHEFGHSFAGLADEYYYEGDTFDNTYPLDIEPWEANITTLVDFDKKWKILLNEPITDGVSSEEQCGNKVSIIEGAAYSAKGLYRGAVDCRMKTNTSKEFCPVCQSAIEKIVKFYTE